MDRYVKKQFIEQWTTTLVVGIDLHRVRKKVTISKNITVLNIRPLLRITHDFQLFSIPIKFCTNKTNIFPNSFFAMTSRDWNSPHTPFNISRPPSNRSLDSTQTLKCISIFLLFFQNATGLYLLVQHLLAII